MPHSSGARFAARGRSQGTRVALPDAMTRGTTQLSVAGVALAVALWAVPPANAQESTEAQAGHNLYEQYCMVCHGLRAHGDGELAEELRVAPADLTTIAKRRGGVFPEVELREIIDGRRRVRAHGPANMPLWGDVFSGQRADGQNEIEIRDKVSSLVVYLRSIQQASASAPAGK
jgi:mono/diheme cytochrome c family protein